MKSESTFNAKQSDEFFFDKFDVGSIVNHSSIEELAAHYDGENATHYMSREKVVEMMNNRKIVIPTKSQCLEEICKRLERKALIKELANEGPMEGLHH